MLWALPFVSCAPSQVDDTASPGPTPVPAPVVLVEETAAPTRSDQDGDGFDAPEDCDDTDAAVFPGATDDCTLGLDGDCDGAVGCDLDEVALWTFEDAGNGWRDGTSVSLGDVNGDGLADMLVGSHDGNARVLVLLSDPSRAPGTHALEGAARWQLRGNGDGYDAVYIGWDNARFLRDLDGDGLAELFVGAAGADHAWLVTGGTLGGAPAFADIGDVADQEIADPGSTSETTGETVSEAGDMDGDGLLDLAVSGAGRVWILPFDLASSYRTVDDGAVIRSFNPAFGDDIVAAGDVDGDGLEDFAIGHATDPAGGELAGQLYLFLGGTMTWGAELPAEEADIRIHGDPGDEFGYDLCAAGDIDGDGRDDWIAAAPWDTDGVSTGTVYLITDSATRVGTSASAADVPATIRGVETYALSAGDMDGDARPDVLASAFSSDKGIWFVRNPKLPVTGSSQIEEIGARYLSDERYFMSRIRADGDVTGDGIMDLLVGYSGSDEDTIWLVPGG